MPKFLLLLLTLCLIGVSVYAYGKDVTDLINEMGYPVEIHYATTDDGFVLAMHRIPTGRSSLSNSIPQNQKKVVFLQHGLLDSSATWVNNFPHQSLGYVLADQGYDVWMGNARGNLYSSKHLRFTKEDKQYWNFSWDEMASYDLVTMVNCALKTTGQQKLAYVGHSQGTTMGFACFTSSSNGSNKPHLCPKDFANKISVFIAIAPVTFVNHATNDMFHAVAHLRLAELIEATGHHEFLPSTDLVQELLPNLCKKSKMDKNFCLNIYCITGGCDNSVNHVNMTRLPVYFARLPAGTSTKNMIHWAQMVRKNNFQMLDRGLIGNRRQYGQFSTPQYNLKNLSVDVALYHGGLDVLGDVEDFKQAFKQIPKSRVKTVLFYPDYGHFDFMWGIHAHKDVYPDILLRIKESFN